MAVQLFLAIDDDHGTLAGFMHQPFWPRVAVWVSGIHIL
jgi:hypothetical protein